MPKRRPKTTKSYAELTDNEKRVLDAAMKAAETMDNRMFASMYIHAVERRVYEGNNKFMEFLHFLREPPVDIVTFLEDKDFFGATDLTLWPVVKKAVIDINKDWWKGWTKARGEAILCGGTGCVPGHTEYLSSEGWKRIDEYDGGLVAQYLPDFKTLEFVEPTDYVNKPNTNGFLKIENYTFSMELTPDHRVLHVIQNSATQNVSSMQEVVDKFNSKPYGFLGGIPATFAGVRNTEGLPLTDAEIRLMVAVMADGHFLKGPSHHPRYCRVGVKKQRKVDRMVLLCEEAKIVYRIYEWRGYTRFSFLAPERNKTYEGWWVANRRQLEIIRDEVPHWDGSVRSATRSSDEFYTSIREVADFIQYVGCATGSKTSIFVDKRIGKKYGEKVYKTDKYRVTFQHGNYHNLHKDARAVSTTRVSRTSHDRSYCFTVPSSFFVIRQNGHVMVTGNTGKSEIAKITTAYHAHILGCMNTPQKYWGLPTATSIVFLIQSAKPNVTKNVLYTPLRAYIETMPWFMRNMQHDKYLESELYFPKHNVRIVQGGTDSDSVLGEALIGGVIDEINFMNVVKRSKKAALGTGRDGTYDQGQNLYDTVTRRKKGRFQSQGPNVGVLVVGSSTRYVKDFTDRRKAQVIQRGIETTYVYDKAQYDVVPVDRYSGEKFRLVVSTTSASDVRVLDDNEKVPTNATVVEVPIEYKEQFLNDPAGAMRDIVGKSAAAINPFFRQQSKIYAAVVAGEEAGLRSFLHKDNVVLGVDGMPSIVTGHYCQNPGKPRYVHIDLAKNSDRVGIAMLRFDGMVYSSRIGEENELLPTVSVEMAVTIEPDHGAEVDIAEVRMWVKQLKTRYGYPIRAVSYDGWNSIESIQAWRKMGMKTGVVPIDRSSSHYKQLRDAIYDGRVHLYTQDVLIDELKSLEYDETKDKIDHPVEGGKDCADAVCGAYSTLITRSASWHMPPGVEDEGYTADRFDEDRMDAGRA